jgi:hypothetical protein
MQLNGVMQALEEIRALILRHARAGDGTTALANVRLRKAETGTRPMNSVCEPAFALVAQGRKRTVLGTRCSRVLQRVTS